MGRGLLYIFLLFFSQTWLLANDEDIEYSLVQSEADMRAIRRFDDLFYNKEWRNDVAFEFGSIVQAKRGTQIIGFLSFMVVSEDDIEIGRLLIRPGEEQTGVHKLFFEELSAHAQSGENIYYAFQPTPHVLSLFEQNNLLSMKEYEKKKIQDSRLPQSHYETLGIAPDSKTPTLAEAYKTALLKADGFETLAKDFYSPESKADKESHAYQKQIDDMYAGIGLPRRNFDGEVIPRTFPALETAINLFRDDVWQAYNILGNAMAKEAYDNTLYRGAPKSEHEKFCLAEYRRLSNLPRQ